jgi:hypothetical protein
MTRTGKDGALVEGGIRPQKLLDRVAVRIGEDAGSTPARSITKEVQMEISEPHQRFADMCIAGAREHEKQARALRRLARKTIHPDPGTKVWCDGYSVRIIKEVDPWGLNA